MQSLRESAQSRLSGDLWDPHSEGGGLRGCLRRRWSWAQGRRWRGERRDGRGRDAPGRSCSAASWVDAAVAALEGVGVGVGVEGLARKGEVRSV